MNPSLKSIQSQIIKKGQQGTQSNLNKGMVEDLDIRIPSIPEQEAIVKILTDFDVDISLLEGKKRKTFFIKNGMMQELLSGRIRLV